MYVIDTEVPRYHGSFVHILGSLRLSTDLSGSRLMYHTIHIVIGTR